MLYVGLDLSRKGRDWVSSGGSPARACGTWGSVQVWPARALVFWFPGVW